MSELPDDAIDLKTTASREAIKSDYGVDVPKDGDYMLVAIPVDHEARIAELEAEIDNLTEQLTNAMVGYTNFGMERQHRSFVIPDLGAFWGAGFTDVMQEAVKPYEVDGWVARIEVRRNNHRATPDKGYRVSFYRYVPPGTPDTHPKDDQQ